MGKITQTLLFFLITLNVWSNDIELDDCQNFTFAIIADPQVSGRDSRNAVAVNAQYNLEKACQELSSTDPKPDFTIFLGDLVNVFNKQSVDNFRECIKHLDSKIYLVHGNHDTKYPYTDFINLHKVYNPHLTDEYYSFNHKGWLFIALPCVTNLSEELTSWLDIQLRENINKPVVILEHYPLLPIGLSQMEFYTFSISARLELMNILTRYGNVRYYFNGHVHNGVKTSYKVSWEYKGINFVTVPTIVSVRPFGEEYAGFDHDNNGGFYMTLNTSGRKLNIKGRQVGSSYVHQYNTNFHQFTENIEPRWFKVIDEIETDQHKIINSDFSNSTTGWFKKYRYMRDENPAFVYDTLIWGNQFWLNIQTHASEPEDWADDEYSEVYQIIKTNPQKTVRLFGNFMNKGFHNGGGFIRVTAFNRAGTSYMFMFKWGENESDASYVPRCLGFELQGKSTSWNFLSEEGNNRKAFYINIGVGADTINTINSDLGEIYDDAMKEKGAFLKLGIEKIYIGVGTWCNKNKGAYSNAYFTNIYAGSPDCLPSKIPAPVNYIATRKTEFGKSLDERVKSRNKIQ